MGLLFGMVLVISGCDHKEGKTDAIVLPQLPHDEVLLPPTSLKRNVIHEEVMQLTAAPVMEPVAGKIAYDDTRTARITAPVAGRIVSGLPALGSQVRAGDPLLELDSPELGQAKEVYANALADRQLAESAWSRAKTLFDHGVLPRKELQEAENNLTHAKGDVEQSQMRLKNLGASDNQINNRYWVRSPISGVITERHVTPGLEVRPEREEPLFVVSDLSSLWVQMNVFEKDLSLIQIGTEVRVSVPAYPGDVFSAQVEYIDKLVDDVTRSIRVRCKIPNPEGKLLPAMYATAEIISGPRDQAIVVPLTALFTEGEGDQVFIKVGDGHYKQRDVKVRLRLKDKAVLSAGILPGETIVVEGTLLLRTEEAQEQSDGIAKGQK